MSIGSRTASFRDSAWEASMKRNTNEWLDRKVADWVSKAGSVKNPSKKYENLTAGTNKGILF